MLMTLLAGALVTAAPLQELDTTVSVPAGARLDVHAFGGEVIVRTWERNALRVRAEHASRDRVDVEVTGAVVRVRPRTGRGMPRAVDFELTVPATMDLDIGGTYLEVSIEGARGSVKVETMQGDVRLVGGRNFVTLQAVQGDVTCRDADGRLVIGSVNGDVELTNVSGEISAETVNGDLALRGVTSGAVSVSTVNGEITYDGTIRDGGRYSFGTHNGDITVMVPERVNATIWISTFNGEFEADFPVQLTEARSGGKRFSFQLGDGSARLELDSFGGTIQLRRRARARR